MQVIGAGLPRTATTTQMVVLEQLGFAPCYHMRDLLADLEKGLPLWEAVAEGKPDWDTIFGEAKSTDVDRLGIVDDPLGHARKRVCHHDFIADDTVGGKK